jgi:hypothetical protein
MDQVVGRLQAALASATSEVTLAAANINFDFSIVKYEAPEEFRPVGQLLSDRRKRDAEDGKSHTTARRLAALFAGVCPKTPALVKAYGKRASEIAAQAASKVSKAHFDSVFSQYTGVDATSMWAAATSSQEGADGGAIHVHLLACMLASAWEAPEATSIWAEMVAERRHEIALEVDRSGFVPFATAAAAGQAEIPRQQLAEWDASARAWLEVANTVKKKDQTQLRLILQNVGLSIPSEGSVARNVIGAWSKAVTTMDNLISGIPQEVSDGSAIVGLMAWHIYPDIQVFGPRNVEVRMNDDLVRPGGILTLGCSPSATTPKSGITWSLSLSKLRFYGKSVRATTTVQEDASRLSANEFRLVLVGCLLRAWNMAPADDKTNIRLLGDLANTILQALQDKGATDAQVGPQFCQHARTWLGAMILLKNAADDYAAGEAEYDAFVTLGRNRPQYAPKPCGEGGRIVGFRPLFGMLEPSSFLSSLRGPEKRIDALRRIASRLPGLSQAHAVIRYKTTAGKVKYERLSPLPANEHAQVASAGAGQRDLLQWVDADCPVGPSKGPAPRSSNQDDFSDDEMTDICYDSEMSDGNDSSCHDGDDFEVVFTASFVCPTGTRFQFLFGDPDFAGIYLPLQTIHTVPVPRISADDLSWVLQDRTVDLDLGFLGEDDPMLPWLSRFHYALVCLQSLPEPVISVQTLRNDVQNAKWALAWDQKRVGGASHFYAPEAVPLWLSKLSKLALSPWKMPAKETFSVLAYFLSGCNVGPDELLDGTTGISFGNSIYVPTEVSCRTGITSSICMCAESALTRLSLPSCSPILS